MNSISVNRKYSTTQLLSTELPQSITNSNDKLQTQSFLCRGVDRKGEGGLRTKGSFKNNYKKQDGKWQVQHRIDKTTKPININIVWNNLELPLITVITVVFNGAKFLEEAIQSVINQTYPNVEYIIIDGGSTDGTIEIIQKYEHAIDYWVSEKDEGIYDAMNKSMSLAGGNWIFFLGADDKFYSEFTIENTASLMSLSNSIYYGNVTLSKTGLTYGGKFSKYKLMQQNICHQSIFYPAIIYKNKCYDTAYKLLADYKYNIELFGEGWDFIHMPNIISIFNETGISSHGDELFNKWKLRLIRNSFGIIYYIIKLARTITVSIYKEAR